MRTVPIGPKSRRQAGGTKSRRREANRRGRVERGSSVVIRIKCDFLHGMESAEPDRLPVPLSRVNGPPHLALLEGHRSARWDPNV